MANYPDIVKWIMDLSLKNTQLNNTNNISDFLKIHNFVGRFFLKVKNNKDKYFSEKFLKSLCRTQEKIKKHIRNNIVSINNLQDELPKNLDFIIFKGISTYVLTEKEEVLRKGDVDILSNDPNLLIKTLIDLKFKQTKKPFLNELGEYTKNKVEFDVQSYFPVYFYSKVLLSAELRPFKNSEKWYQSYKINQHKILYSDLLKYSYINKNLSISKTKVADVNILIIIICAHAFLNYVNIWSISHKEKAYVKLGEIFDLFDLSEHKLFNPNIFLNLVKLLNAQDAVEWAASVCKMLFNKNPLPVPDSKIFIKENFASRFPRCLWWNFWVNIPVEPSDLVQKQEISAIKVIDNLKSQQMQISKNTTGKYSTILFKNTNLLKHFISQSRNLINFVLEIKLSNDGISLNINVKPERILQKLHIRVDFGIIASEIIYFVDERKTLITGTPVNVVSNNKNFEFEFLISYQNKELKKICDKKEIPLLFGISKFSPNIDASVNSILVPIKLIV